MEPESLKAKNNVAWPEYLTLKRVFDPTLLVRKKDSLFITMLQRGYSYM